MHVSARAISTDVASSDALPPSCRDRCDRHCMRVNNFGEFASLRRLVQVYRYDYMCSTAALLHYDRAMGTLPHKKYGVMPTHVGHDCLQAHHSGLAVCVALGSSTKKLKIGNESAIEWLTSH